MNNIIGGFIKQQPTIVYILQKYRAPNLQYPNSVPRIFSTFHDISVYFSENLAYYASIMLILKPNLRSVFLQYFASKISTSTEESVPLEALQIFK